MTHATHVSSVPAYAEQSAEHGVVGLTQLIPGARVEGPMALWVPHRSVDAEDSKTPRGAVMNTPEQARPVVVGYSGSGAGDASFDWAREEAERRRVPLEMAVAEGPLYAAGPGFGTTAPWPQGFAEALREEAKAYVETRAPGLGVTVTTSVGTPASVLVDASRRAELVVVGRHEHSVAGEFLGGSTSAQVIAHAVSPVVVVDRPFSGSSAAPVVVGVDGSPEGNAALEFAFHRAAALDAPIVAVHGWWLEDPGHLTSAWLSAGMTDDLEAAGRRTLESSLAPWLEKFPHVTVRTALKRQYPAEAVLGASTDSQLIVVGSRGHGGFVGLLLGSVSQGLLHHRDRPCPLAVLHGNRDRVRS